VAKPADFPAPRPRGSRGNMSEVEPGHQREAQKIPARRSGRARGWRSQTAEQVFKLGEKGHEEERAGVAGVVPLLAFCAPYFSAFAGELVEAAFVFGCSRRLGGLFMTASKSRA